MIEMIYNGKETEELGDVRVPKNIHQIGENKSNKRIYIEDYVMNTLKKAPEAENGIRYGVLLGEIKRSKDNSYIFVRGMVETREIIENSIIFNDDIWATIYRDVKSYFEGLEIVGWYVSVPYTVRKDLTFIQKLHLDNFAGNDKICYLNDRSEHEDGFYMYRDCNFIKMEGYYIFYEKNERMKKYLKQTQGQRSVLVTPDDVDSIAVGQDAYTDNIMTETKTISSLDYKIDERDTIKVAKARALMEKKRESNVNNVKENPSEKVHMTFRDVVKKQVEEECEKPTKFGNFAYGVSSILIIALLLSTVVMLNNYGELKSLKASIDSMNENDSVEVVNEILSSIMPTTSQQESGQTEDGKTIGDTSQGNTIDNPSQSNKDINNSKTENNNEAIDNRNNKNSIEDTNNVNENRAATNNTGLEDLEQELKESNHEIEIEPNNPQNDSVDTFIKSENGIHIVLAGQTLYDISVGYYGNGSMVETLKVLNNIGDDYMIKEGQEIILP